ncbi:hypothetical protein K432DRAFT_359401 [Lepidopterella palustris CBS 459.81]|uniref:Uncharacterized protein n=1 Tax=Lepidopterella palustris CBS 459.81 TaxID=1314670 RepID=A0A8E2E3Y6_9PEZI|nr:hypothetical protein K432DRAFT_359401 [Lepidopterella palustris CBS 459.81]
MKIAQLAFSKKELSLAVFNPPRFKLLVEEHRENMILERRLTYIASLPDKLAMDYKLMFLLLSSVFRMSLESTLDNDYKPWIFDLGFGIDGPGLLRKGNSWMTWYILHEGPSMFWEQWWLQPRDDPGTQSWVCDRSIAAWLRDTTSSHSLQRKVAHKIQETIEARAGTFSESDSNPIPYFTRYAEHRRSRIANGEPDPDETMDQVPFHVDFRCPEKPKGRFCFSKQRDISIVRSD